MTRVPVSGVRFAPASDLLRDRGVVGCACLTCGELELNCLAIRRTPSGEYALSFPSRTNATGVMYPQYSPIDAEMRHAIEAEVLGDLRRRGILPAASHAGDGTFVPGRRAP